MILPGPAPVAGQGVLDLNTPGNPVRNSIREIPIVIQGRSFNADGSLFYPDNRAFFEGLNVAGTDANGQFPPGTGELRIPMDPIDPNNPSDIAPIWKCVAQETFTKTHRLDSAAQWSFRTRQG